MTPDGLFKIFLNSLNSIIGFRYVSTTKGYFIGLEKSFEFKEFFVDLSIAKMLGIFNNVHRYLRT